MLAQTPQSGKYVFTVLIGISLAIVIELYLPSLSYQYVFDDRLIFVGSRRLRDGWESVANIAMPVIANTTYFRPAVLLSFVAEFSLFDATPKVSKTVNLALHLFNAVLVCLLARRYFLLGLGESVKKPAVTWANAYGLFGTLLYAMHPSLIESVAWVSGRFDLMVTLFSLLALYIASDFRRTPPKFAIATLILLALLSKEMAIMLPVIVVFFRIACYYRVTTEADRFTFFSDKKLVAAMSVSVLIYLALRAMVHPQMMHVDSVVFTAFSSPFAHVLFVGRTLVFYLQLVVYPYRDTNPLHPFDSHSLDTFDTTNVFAVAALLVFSLLPVLAWRFRRVDLWLWLAFPVSLLPVLNIIPLRLSGGIGENRFLTLPLAIFVVALGFTLAKLVKRDSSSSKLVAIGSMVFALMLLSANAAFVRITLPIWQDDLTLFRSTFRQYSSSGRAAAQYLRAAFQRDQVAQALADIEASPAAQVFPQAYQAVFALSLAQVGRKDDAIRNFEQAITWRDSEGLPSMEALRWYTESMQAWGMANEAGAMMEKVRALRKARVEPDGDYFISILEIRQRILLGEIDGYSDELAAMQRFVAPELYEPLLKDINGFKATVCRRHQATTTNPFCLGSR